jgi:hypothetical protein
MTPLAWSSDFARKIALLLANTRCCNCAICASRTGAGRPIATIRARCAA